MSPYVPRSVASALRRRLDAHPVAIVEGARGVGKTSMCQAEFRGWDYANLDVPATRSLASADLDAWVGSLRDAAVIDEAQLLDGLAGAVKRAVDGPRRRQFILTGSRSLARTGLGGSDPLTRRSSRTTLWPLTLWEEFGQPGSLVDLLFEATPKERALAGIDDDELSWLLLRGGFPGLASSALASHDSLIRTVRADIDAALGDETRIGERLDAVKARALLHAVLTRPGEIFVVRQHATRLEIDARTIERYIAIFENAYLVHALPNLATFRGAQPFARQKLHPVDSSFSVAELAAGGRRLPRDREALGETLESAVVQQIVAATQWAELTCESYYWRLASRTNPEVDLVLKDAAGRLVGIEVKASRSVAPADLRGLRALRETSGLHRGYIIYLGDEVRYLGDDLWALPISALGDADAFATTTTGAAMPEPETTAHDGDDIDANVFLSYVHDDDTQLQGRLVAFAKDVQARYSFLTGGTVRLFVDRASLQWGEQWQSRLDSELSTTEFLLAMVTPRYLRSASCRAEVLDFAQAPRRVRLLPALVVDPRPLRGFDARDEVWSQITAAQYVDLTALRAARRDTDAYDRLVEEVAQRLVEAIDDHLASRAPSTPSSAQGSTDAQVDIVDAAVRFEASQEPLQRAIERVKTAMPRVTAAIGTLQPGLAPKEMQAAATAAAKRSVEPLAELDAAVDAVRAAWDDAGAAATELVEASTVLGSDEHRSGIRDSLAAVSRALVVPGERQVRAQLQGLKMIAAFRPLAQSITGALDVMESIRVAAEVWTRRLQ